MNKLRRNISLILVVAAAGLLAASLKLPLWHLRMEAPQYRDNEALRVTVYPDRMSGDLREIVVLNQYIGVHIPEALPQNRWLPQALLACAIAGIAAAFLPRLVRRIGISVAALGLAGCVAFAVLQARHQMYDIGHKRDAHTKLARVHDFNPPFLGTTKIAQFTVSARLGGGAFLIGAAFALQIAGAITARRKCCGHCGCGQQHATPHTQHVPQPI